MAIKGDRRRLIELFEVLGRRFIQGFSDCDTRDVAFALGAHVEQLKLALVEHGFGVLHRQLHDLRRLVRVVDLEAGVRAVEVADVHALCARDAGAIDVQLETAQIDLDVAALDRTEEQVVLERRAHLQMQDVGIAVGHCTLERGDGFSASGHARWRERGRFGAEQLLELAR